MMASIKHITLSICLFMTFSNSIGQTIEKLDLNRGVDAYNNGDYGTAQDKFEKAFEANNQYNGALYNAANSAYRSGDFEKATEYYEQYAGTLENKNDKAKAYHNLGNAFLKRFSGSSQNQNPEEQKKSSDYLKNSIEAYKNSLRNNPKDEDTRYNLSYALSKLKQQQQQENKEGKDEDENKDEKEQDKKENEDNKDSDKSEEEKEGNKDKKEGEGDKEDKKNEDKDKEGDKPKPGDKDKGKEKEIEGKMSKSQIKKDLDAVNEDEKNILLKIAKQKGKKKGDNNTKDW